MSRIELTTLLMFPLIVVACDTDDAALDPVEDPAEDEVSQRDLPINPCASLTPSAVQHTIDLIDDSIADIEAYLAESQTNDDAPGQSALDALVAARDFIVTARTWAEEGGYLTPYITNQSVAGGQSNEWARAGNSLTFAMRHSYLAFAADHSELAWTANLSASEARTHVVDLANKAVECCMFWSVFPCGNGIWQGAEQCDDGNKLNGDGCSSTCTIEP